MLEYILSPHSADIDFDKRTDGRLGGARDCRVNNVFADSMQLIAVTST